MLNEISLQQLIKQGENQSVEFKEKFTTEIGKEISAFANSNDGYIFIGVDDSGNIVGVKEDIAEIEKRLLGICRNNIDPPLIPKIDNFSLEGLNVAVISINKSQYRPHKWNRICYIRALSETRSATREEEERMWYDTGRITYITKPVPEANYEDLNESKIVKYLSSKLSPDTLAQNGRSIKQIFMDSRDFFVPYNNRLVPNIASILLFGKQPQWFLPHSTVKSARFNGTEIDGLITSREFFTGTIDDLITSATSFVARNMNIAIIKEDYKMPYRTEVYEYPLKAIREAIANAVIHRDYSVYGAEVTIRMFNDRMEIQNPGGLFGGLKLEDIGTGKHIARNPTIANVMNELGIVEKFGTGVKLIQRELENLGSGKAKIIADEQWFTIILPAKNLSEYLRK